MSRFQLWGAGRSGRLAAVAVCIAALLVTSVGATAANAALDPGSAAPAATAAKKKKAKKCRKGYKRVTIKVKRKRGGRTVTVRVKKCRKAKKKSNPGTSPVPGKPSPVPGPAPTTSVPKIDQILGWSTVGQDPDTPPADLVADGGTIATCPVTNSLSVYIRRSGFTAVGLVSHVWKRDGVVIATGTNGTTYNGAFRNGITISPVNGIYEITWSFGGTPIGTSRITRSC